MLIAKILKGIPDTCKMSSFINMPSPISELIKEYNKYCFTKNVGEIVTGDTTGEQLKASIRSLNTEDQIALLDKYQKAITSYDDPITQNNSSDEHEIRNIKSFSIKALLIFLLSVTFMSTYYYLNSDGDGEKEKKVMETMTVTTKDVFNTIFGVKPEQKKEKEK